MLSFLVEAPGKAQNAAFWMSLAFKVFYSVLLFRAVIVSQRLPLAFSHGLNQLGL
jgi:hypothetical protein